MQIPRAGHPFVSGSFAVAAAAAGLLVWAQACLEPDFSGECGPDKKGCFKNEKCIDGKCWPKDNLPDDEIDTSTGEDTASTDTISGDTDVSPPDETDVADTSDTDEGCPYAGQDPVGVCTGYVPVEEGACEEIPYVDEEENEDDVCDGLDNDCDGTVDEGCACDPGTIYDCYRGSAEHAGEGICRWGQQDGCNEDDERRECVEGRQIPENERCGDSRDNDCDGKTDEEDCFCTYDPGEEEFFDTDGSHSSGVCLEQRTDADGACQRPDEFEEQEERSCDDGLDNDCDGRTDTDGGSDGGEPDPDCQ